MKEKNTVFIILGILAAFFMLVLLVSIAVLPHPMMYHHSTQYTSYPHIGVTGMFTMSIFMLLGWLFFLLVLVALIVFIIWLVKQTKEPTPKEKNNKKTRKK